MSEPKYKYKVAIGSTKQRYDVKPKKKKKVVYKDRYIQQKTFSETIRDRLANIRKAHENEFANCIDYFNETVDGLCIREVPVKWSVKYNDKGNVTSYYPGYNRDLPAFIGTYKGKSIIVDVRMSRFYNRAPAPDINIDTHIPFIESGALAYYIFYMDFGKEIYVIDSENVIKRFDDGIRSINIEYLTEKGMKLDTVRDFIKFLDK